MWNRGKTPQSRPEAATAPLGRGGETRTPPLHGRRGARTRFREVGKDLVIVFLALSAVYLILRTQSRVELPKSGGIWGSVVAFFQGGGGAETPANRPENQILELQPVRMSVNLAGVGTYGVQYDTAAVDKLSDKMFILLGEALSSAKEPRSVTEQVWRDALANRDNVYFDFQGQVPLAVLYAWTEAGTGEALAGESTRRLLLAEDGSGALTLYYSNETTGMYYACETADTLTGHLQTAVDAYSANLNDSTFAFEHSGGEGYEKLSPYVMLPKSKTPVRRAVYRAANPIGSGTSDQSRTDVIEALGFHPQANTSYMAGGKQVVREGADTLSVYDTGAIDYHSASLSEPMYPVGDGTGTPSLLEMVEAVQPLAEKSVGAYCGDPRTARIYLKGVTDRGNGAWQVDYGYLLNGAVVQLGNEGYAARFIISDGRVSDFYLHLRSYTATEEQVSVLPELQAAAAMGALKAGGKELLLCYEDNGGTEALYPGWVAE